jgi:hypothetical protein
MNQVMEIAIFAAEEAKKSNKGGFILTIIILIGIGSFLLTRGKK